MKRLWIIGKVALFVLVFAAAAWASDGGEAHGLNWKDFLYRTINFLLVVGVIVKLAGKKMVGFFRNRRVQIENQLADLEARKSESQKKLAEIEKGISNLASEREKILAEFKAQGEAQRDAIVAAAEKAAAQIKQQAQMTAEQEAKAAIDGLRAEIADMVVVAAEKLLAEKLTPQDQDKLIDEYLTKVVLN